MPDESCRSCGGDLGMHLRCKGCRKAIQKVCQTCNALTRREFHGNCEKPQRLANVQGSRAVETIHLRAQPKGASQARFVPMLLGAVGFFILGITVTAYLGGISDISSSSMAQPGNVLAESPSSLPNTYGVLQNCLAYGSGGSVTVTCPTPYGYVYKAILDMPKDLAGRFSGSMFSIRGVSLVENADATVVLQYQNSKYLTSFFAS